MASARSSVPSDWAMTSTMRLTPQAHATSRPVWLPPPIVPHWLDVVKALAQAAELVVLNATGTGKGLQTWGGPGRDVGQMAYPWGVAVDKHDRVAAVDAGNNRVQVFRF